MKGLRWGALGPGDELVRRQDQDAGDRDGLALPPTVQDMRHAMPDADTAILPPGDLRNQILPALHGDKSDSAGSIIP